MMVCDKCKIDMRVREVIDGNFYFTCKKCGKEEVHTDKELNDYYNSKKRVIKNS